MEGLKRLLRQAGAMLQSRVVEVVSGKVGSLLSQAQSWESEAKAALKQRSVSTHIIYMYMYTCIIYTCMYVNER